MKTTLYTLCAAALLLASCANDPAEGIPAGTPGTNGSNLPQGTFVIDYTASTGDAQTRLAANERIQSLDYLLYEKTAGGNDFLLKKKRSIPDIGSDTQWPLTRENMTWAQREALKDTLNQSSEYKMVFVANADPEIWDNSPVLENVDEGDNFNDGRLVLPPRLFTNKDMYYMWSNHDDPLVGSRYNKDNPASMEITLERMINKVEVKLDETWSKYTEEELDAELNRIIEDYYEGLISSDPQGTLYTDVKDRLDKLAAGLSVGALYGVYGNARDEVKRFIGTPEFANGIINTDMAQFATEFKNELFNIYKTQCYWAKASTVKIEYETEAYAQAIDFTTKTVASKEKDELNYELIDNAFVYYTFGNNVSGESNTLNQVANFLFMKENESEPVLIIPGTELPINDKTGGNNYYQFACNPIGNIDDTNKKTYELPAFNIKEKYGTNNWTEDNLNIVVGSLNTFENYLNNNSGYNDPDDEGKEYVYKASKLTEIYLKFDYPDVTVSPTWEQNQ